MNGSKRDSILPLSTQRSTILQQEQTLIQNLQEEYIRQQNDLKQKDWWYLVRKSLIKQYCKANLIKYKPY
jgi:hypothetical protein